MTAVTHVDILIVGGGLVGVVAALALTQQNFQVALVEQSAPSQAASGPVARVSSINVASLNFLKRLNVLEHVSETAMASLQRLVVWDGVGQGEIEFDAATLGLQELGRIIENRALLGAAHHVLKTKTSLLRFSKQRPLKLTQLDSSVAVALDSGTIIHAKLCLGADGAHSWVRDQMAVPLATRAYQQTAIIGLIETEQPHQATGWQVFLPTGPLALLPLANPHQCAMVWSLSTARAEQVLGLDDLEFESELNNDFGLRLGLLKCLSTRQTFPLVMRHAQRYVAPRIALVGDAAHSIHPLAGQGVNLGFADVAVLARCVCEAVRVQQDIGSLKPLRRYERSRRPENSQMIAVMRLFNEIFSTNDSMSVALRSQGLSLVDKFPWLKNKMMEFAVGLPSVELSLLHF